MSVQDRRLITQRPLSALLLLAATLVLAPGFTTSMPSLQGDDGPQEPAAYFLVGGDADQTAASGPSIEQIQKAFVPELASVSVGGTVTFPNRDDLVHNVYSPSGPEGFFDMGSSGKTTDDNANLLQRAMANEGVVEVSCAVHPIMKATVFVVPSKYHAVSSDGTYQFGDVPAGVYDLMVMKKDGTVTKLKSVTL